MNTPIVDFVKKYSDDNGIRAHMPGHKGVPVLGFEQYDITEIKGADSLYEADGIIAESEKNATALFGTDGTFFSTEGSTQCIKAMLYLASYGKKNKTVISARNAHKAFLYGCGLLDINVKWLWGSESFSLCRCTITPDELETALCETEACAVYVTSPDYLGGVLDIKALAEIAHSHGVPLIVDNAHGAYRHFLGKKHPMDLGADMCCDSSHKTLPVLTGGAYLHVKEKYVNNAKKALSLFCSTSPSYLILQSLDYCNKYLSDNYENKLFQCVCKVENLKKQIESKGWQVEKSDELKLTVLSSGIDLSERLRKHNIECEYEDPDFTVMMFTPENKESDYIKIAEAMEKCSEKIHRQELSFKMPSVYCSVHDALMGESEKISAFHSEGRVLSSPTVGCPPAVPVVVSGEIINSDAVKIFDYYNINEVEVLK